MPRSKRVEVWTGVKFALQVGPPVPVVDANGDPVLAESGEPLHRIEIGTRLPAPLKIVQQIGEYVPSPKDVAELWGGINGILLFANQHLDNDSRGRVLTIDESKQI